MRCPTAHMLSLYEDELVEGAEREQIQQHVTACAACQRVLALYRAEARFIEKTLRKQHLPESFESELLRQIRPRRKSPLLFVMAVFVLMSVLLFLLVLLTADVVS